MVEQRLRAQFPLADSLTVLITEVTRMTRGYYCVAGWEIHGEHMVRPLSAEGYNWALGTDRSVFSVGRLLSCKPTGRRNTAYPHANEDTPLSDSPKVLATLGESDVYELLLPKSATTIRAAFGCELVDDKFVVDGTDCRSLGGVRVARRHLSFVEDFGRLRLEVDDGDAHYSLAVTSDELRHLFSSGDLEAEPHFGTAEANEWLAVNPPDREIVLRVGLARGWAGSDGSWSPLRCYVQLNGIICPEDNYHIFAGPPTN